MMIRGLVRRCAVVLVCVVPACSSAPKAPPSFAWRVSAAHGADNLGKHPALRGRLLLQSESLPLIDAQFVYDLPTGRLRLDLADKTTLLFDGEGAYVFPADAPYRNIRATYLAWASLMGLPLKLLDSAATVTDLGKQSLGSAEYDAARVSFASAYAGSAGDWFIVYADPRTRLLSAAAFVFTHNRPADESLQERRAVTFYDYKPVGGAQVAMEWKFWKWHASEGLYGRPIGSARLMDVSTASVGRSTFAPPAGSRLDR